MGGVSSQLAEGVAEGVFGGMEARMIAEAFIDSLQKDGFSQLGPQGFSLHKWSPGYAYGSEYGRNKDFKILKKTLVPLIKEGYVQANLHLINSGGRMEDFIIKNLVHHVMEKLLYAENASAINYNSVKKNETFDWHYDLQKYPSEHIEAFQNKFIKLPNNGSISLNTKDRVEQDILSSKLAEMAKEVLDKIDIPSFICGALKAYQEIEKEEKQRIDRKYTAAFSADAEKHLEGRKAYDSEEEDEMKAVARDIKNVKLHN